MASPTTGDQRAQEQAGETMKKEKSRRRLVTARAGEYVQRYDD